MKKMDEMDRNIQLHSIEPAYKVAILCLCAWTLFNSYQTLINGAKYEPFSSFILCLTVCVQSFSQIAMKQKMVAGDEEYKEPNRLVQTIIVSLAIVAVILSIGTYFILKVQYYMKNIIKQLRKEAGLRQEDMAKQLAVSRQTIIAIENDKYNPTLELAMKMAKLLNLHVDEIFFLDE